MKTITVNLTMTNMAELMAPPGLFLLLSETIYVFFTHPKGSFMFKYFKIGTQTSISKSCNLVAIAFNEESDNIKCTSPRINSSYR